MKNHINHIAAFALVIASFCLAGCKSSSSSNRPRMQQIVIGKSAEGRPIHCEIYAQVKTILRRSFFSPAFTATNTSAHRYFNTWAITCANIPKHYKIVALSSWPKRIPMVQPINNGTTFMASTSIETSPPGIGTNNSTTAPNHYPNLRAAPCTR